MAGSQRSVATRGAAAVALVLIGLGCLGLWKITGSLQHTPYSAGATPPSTADVTENKTYSLDFPGGAPAVVALGADGSGGAEGAALSLTCNWSVRGSVTQSLRTTPESNGTKAIDTVAHFLAPVTGAIHITCTDLGTMFVPDADNRAFDLSGLFLLLSVITLSIGAAVGMSALYDASGGSGRAGGDNDEVERLVQLGGTGRSYREVPGGDGRDVAP